MTRPTSTAHTQVAARRAESLLNHYLRRAWVETGLNWNSDNDAEVGLIVDALVEVACEVVGQHLDNTPHLYADGSSA